MEQELNHRIGKIENKVTKLEAEVTTHSKLLDKQQEKNDVQTELNTLLKMQIEANKEQNKTLEKFEATLVKVNNNLDSLNSKQELMDDRVTGIESSLSKQNFSIMDVIRYLGAAVGGLIVGYFAMKFGLK